MYTHTHTQTTHLQVCVVVLTQQLQEPEEGGYTDKLWTQPHTLTSHYTDDVWLVGWLSWFPPPRSGGLVVCCRSNQRQLFLSVEKPNEGKCTTEALMAYSSRSHIMHNPLSGFANLCHCPYTIKLCLPDVYLWHATHNKMHRGGPIGQVKVNFHKLLHVWSKQLAMTSNLPRLYPISFEM